jgi:hypothetical protein
VACPEKARGTPATCAATPSRVIGEWLGSTETGQGTASSVANDGGGAGSRNSEAARTSAGRGAIGGGRTETERGRRGGERAEQRGREDERSLSLHLSATAGDGRKGSSGAALGDMTKRGPRPQR